MVTATTLVARTNVANKPYDDQKVRNALQMAVDNKVVLQLGYGNGRATSAENHHVCPIHPEYYRAARRRRATPPSAKTLMAEAGQADFEHELITIDEDWHKNTGDAVAAQLRDAGIKVKRTVLPGSTFWNDWTKYPYSHDQLEHASAGHPGHRRSRYRTGEAWNETAYSNPDLDAKICRGAGDRAMPSKRKAVMKDIETDPPGLRHHHPALLAQALQQLRARR